jgi:hypothetical protein
MGQTAAKIAILTKDVALDTAPYLFAQSLWFLSRNANMRALSFAFLIGDLVHKVSNIRHPDLIHTIAGIAEICIVSDILGLTPEGITYRVASDSFILIALIMGNSHSISAGTQRLITAYRTTDDTKNKLTNIFSGAIITSLGVMNLHNSLTITNQWISGLQLVQKLSPDQQWGVCRYRAIQELPSKKTCNAVIFDGWPADFGETVHIADPFEEILYQNCNTLIYRVNNASDFCKALDSAKHFFQGPISTVALSGHANSYELSLNSEYLFSVDQHHTAEIICLKNCLSEGGQAFLLGCITALPYFEDRSLAKDLAKALPGRTVIGFADFYNPFTSSTHYSNGLFRIENNFLFLANSAKSFHFSSSKK